MRAIAKHFGRAALAALALGAPVAAQAQPTPQPVDSSTWVDHDGRPIREPKEREKNLYGHQFREAIVEPLSHAFDIPDKLLWLIGQESKHRSANVNAYDEVPNSTWFTNRNHVRAVSLDAIRKGPVPDLMPAPPYVIKSAKLSGVNPGFRIKDAAGKRWLVKLDPPGSPQLGSGADAVVSRLLWAAGYNLPHDVSFRFRREELTIDPDLIEGKESKPFTEQNLVELLTLGHRYEDGTSSAQASLFLEGKPVGHIDMRGKRPDDANDLYTHKNRRELRGLYVLMSWVNNWDTKDHQSLDMFIAEKDQPGYVRHHLVDVGAALGAAAGGPKPAYRGWENTVDWGWMLRRLVSLGFAVEPWRRANEKTGIPSVGNFEYEVYDPNNFRPLQPHPAFRERTRGDAYWGAKLVCSFSDAQIAAAVEGAHYDDPKATEFITKALIARRDKIGEYWFRRVTPVDFFHVQGGELRFRDLAVDRGLSAARRYRIYARPSGAAAARFDLESTALPLSRFGDASEVALEIRAAESGGKPAEVILKRQGAGWAVAQVRHDK